MLFGGIQSTFINSDNETITINGMRSYNETLFKVFRESFGSDLDRDVSFFLFNLKFFKIFNIDSFKLLFYMIISLF